MSHRKRRVVLTALTIVLVLTVLPSAIALADCKITSTNSSGDDQVYCQDPDDTNGISTGGGNDYIYVKSDTEVRSSGTTIDTGSGNDRVENRGRVTSSGGDAINFRTGSDRMDNYGYIQGYDDGVWCTPSSGHTCSFYNYSGGRILANNEVLDIYNQGGSTVVHNWGLVQSTYQEAIHFNATSGTLTVNNRGTLDARRNAIEAYQGRVSLTNSGTVYSRRERALQFYHQSDSVSNSGTIRADYDPAIHLAGGNDSLTNTGTIQARNDSSSYAAVQMGDGDDRVTTSGNIRELGYGYAAIALMNGNDRITVRGGDINKVIHGGGGYDILIFELNGTTSEVETFRKRIMTQSPSGGSATWRTWTYRWSAFEEIRMILNGTTYTRTLSTTTASTDTMDVQSMDAEAMGAESLDGQYMAEDAGDGVVDESLGPVEDIILDDTQDLGVEPVDEGIEESDEVPNPDIAPEPTLEPTPTVTEEPAPVTPEEPTQQADDSVLAPGYYEDNAIGFIYTGSWAYYARRGASGDGYMRTREYNASVTFRFEGSRLTLYRTLHNNRGAMEVCINAICYVVENHSTGLTLAAPVVFDVPQGLHEVVIRNLSEEYIDLDAVLIETGTDISSVADDQAPSSSDAEQDEPAPTATPSQQSGESGTADN